MVIADTSLLKGRVNASTEEITEAKRRKRYVKEKSRK